LSLLQLRVLRLGFLQDRNIGVGVFPEREEIFVGGERLGGITLQSVGAGEADVGQRVDGFVGYNSAMAEDFLQLGSLTGISFWLRKRHPVYSLTARTTYGPLLRDRN
jgi:hypothetical protein